MPRLQTHPVGLEDADHPPDLALGEVVQHAAVVPQQQDELEQLEVDLGLGGGTVLDVVGEQVDAGEGAEGGNKAHYFPTNLITFSSLQK